MAAAKPRVLYLGDWVFHLGPTFIETPFQVASCNHVTDWQSFHSALSCHVKQNASSEKRSHVLNA